MTSPKEALEYIHNHEDLSIKSLQIIEAAIPVAELEHQAVELLIDHHPNERQWREKKNAIIRKLEALK